MTGYLLDTHLLLWAAVDSPRLPARARSVLEDPVAEVSFSVVSLWEIVIKLGLGRPDFQVDVAALRTNARLSGIEEVPVYGEHVLAVKDLPPLHQDPFDRLLVAQAIVEGITLLTADIQVAKYAGPVQRV